MPVASCWRRVLARDKTKYPESSQSESAFLKWNSATIDGPLLGGESYCYNTPTQAPRYHSLKSEAPSVISNSAMSIPSYPQQLFQL